MNRKEFIRNSIGAAGVLGSLSFTNVIPFQDVPQLDKKLVGEFVGSSHGKMDIVKTLLEEHPNLINAAHDWGHGDFETGLGACSHVGYKELIHFFIENGAQPNIFTAAVLGRMDVLKPMLDLFPSALNAKGPHGFTLLHHANKGGDDALEVKEYLVSLGAKETKFKLY